MAFLINPLNSNIKIQLLICYPHRFPMKVVERSCWSISTNYLLWPCPQFSWPLCFIEHWSFREKFDTDQSQRVIEKTSDPGTRAEVGEESPSPTGPLHIPTCQNGLFFAYIKDEKGKDPYFVLAKALKIQSNLRLSLANKPSSCKWASS